MWQAGFLMNQNLDFKKSAFLKKQIFKPKTYKISSLKSVPQNEILRGAESVEIYLPFSDTGELAVRRGHKARVGKEKIPDLVKSGNQKCYSVVIFTSSVFMR